MALRKATGSYRKQTNKQTKQKNKKVPLLGLRQRQRILPKCFEHCGSRKCNNLLMGLWPLPYEQGFSLPLAIALETKVLSSDIDLSLVV